ncbi:hypothetical protein I3760_02G009800 [Carya illinoinensis]|uniref:Uncharacterized protein n=1 Tax=Carya illinoinensis TaxID=32201 RepID=A0A8T1R735_CARIL|nr:hypothetical protein I3760_02G009800 [Carya illinoinensis]KAG6663180.1 hypothetical protein CIPAW_02G009100 [Carya illinoinensis]KAG6724963.1 hypothetical protein I3842_02G010000 [Carya illinoinensis]
MAQNKLNISVFLFLALFLFQGSQLIQGRRLLVSKNNDSQPQNKIHEMETTINHGTGKLHGDETTSKEPIIAKASHPPPPPPAERVFSSQPPPPPGHGIVDFRPTTPGHSPGVGHSIQN